MFLPTTTGDPEYSDRRGARVNDNLIEAWRSATPGRRYVWNEEQFAALGDTNDQVLGLFEPSHMRYEVDRESDAAGEPSLAAMTAFAVRRLARAGDGFFLMVEGGRIDHGHHAGNAYRALFDVLAFADAVQVAMDLTDPGNTLILVTADHSHTLTISGYPRRGNPILGIVESPLGEVARDAQGRPYTTLGYANGPGHALGPANLSNIDTQAIDFRQVAAVPMAAETHSGEDVAAYARGPNAASLGGVIEQEELYTVLRGALFPDDPT